MTENYRLALLRVVAELFVSAGMASDNAIVEKLPRHVRNAILLILRPAESASRRIFAMAARHVDVPEYVVPPKRDRLKNKGTGKKRGPRAPQFCLIDPRKYFPELHPNRRNSRPKRKPSGSTEPQIQVRIAGFDGGPDFILWSEPKAILTPDDEVSAKALCRRLLALKLALEDMPKQAERYVREVAKRKAAAPGPKSVPPLRMGLPPGYRKKHIHKIDEILWDCHCLVRQEPRPPDKA